MQNMIAYLRCGCVVDGTEFLDKCDRATALFTEWRNALWADSPRAPQWAEEISEHGKVIW